MGSDRRLRIFTRLAAGGANVPGPDRLCAVCAEVTAMSGAGLMLMSTDVQQGSVCTSDGVSEQIEALQHDLGEGPCMDAHRYGYPVLEPDLAAPATPRWVAFTPPAVEAGARAVFGFPLQVGAVRLGALNLYHDRPRAITDDQHADALLMADVAAHSMLAWQVGAPPDGLADELETDTNLQLVVHQASGMVAVRLGIGVAEALVRLRAHAFGQGRPLTEIARAVVDRRLRFDPDSGDGGTDP